ncbi:DsbE family thiol:disulfide interchange protein [Jannaschia sp. CCS1]|uniref:DsbE family thiol:disulfide interchange protein n=1 Tax=Jannaschia sp. (strain CCS1) TaxID=290400 RepID=UPI000053C635|nr:DsbE family thiol:disulfide interchange protein [Jannaschia sp. CCS1]ABD55567.1 periplasmic protein thiol [Jannaschia sp. CCS1]
MKVNWLMILPLALTAGFFGLAGWQLALNQDAQTSGVDTQSLPSAQQGAAAPPLDLETLAGTPLLTRDDLEGEDLVILNFFASWCPPCRAEHPTLTALAEAGVPLYGVNYRDRDVQALSFLEELGNPYDLIGTDPEARNGRDWGVVAMPETFFINSDGVVVLHFRGPIVRRSLENQVRPALTEAGYSLPDLAPLGAAETN